MAVPTRSAEDAAVVEAPAFSPPPSSSAPQPRRPSRQAEPAQTRRQRPLKQKMALSFKSLVSSAQKLVLGDNTGSSQNGSATSSGPEGLFPATSPAVDGDDCDHDCGSCSIKYPRDFKIDEADELYGHVKGWSTHVLVATSKSDWVRDVADEKGSVMEALDREVGRLRNGRMMLSASNMPTPHGTSDYSEPTTVLLLPAFALVHGVSPASVPSLVDSFINRGPTSTTPLAAPLSIPRSVPALSTQPPSSAGASSDVLTATPSPHNVLILLCSQKTRDARCGQSAPLLKRELERHLRPLGLYRDADDSRPGGVGIYFISHVGGHKYSANMMVYRRPNAYGVDDVDRAGPDAAGFKIDPLARFKAQKEGETAVESNGHAAATASEKQQQPLTPSPQGEEAPDQTAASASGEEVITDDGASQCIWLARIKPEDCENIVRYTVLQGRVVKPGSQLRGGFDRGRSLVSW